MSTDFKLYVASLSDYNNAILHGRWFDLDAYSDVEDLQEAIDAMLSESPTAKREGVPAEEYAIHDYEGFPQGSIREYSNLSDVWELWEAFERADNDDNLDAFMAYYEYFDSLDYSDFEDRYQGYYRTEEDYAEQFLDDTGELNAIPERLRYYFDYAAYARDIFCGDCIFCDGHVFWNH